MRNAIRYWRISPGEGGRIWREQKLHDCVSIGWWEIGNVTSLSKKGLEAAVEKLGWSKQACTQIRQFRYELNIGDKVVVSASKTGIYALGTVMGNYQFNNDLEYRQTRKVRWETTFWQKRATLGGGNIVKFWPARAAVVVAGADHTVRIYDLSTRQLQTTLSSDVLTTLWL